MTLPDPHPGTGEHTSERLYTTDELEAYTVERDRAQGRRRADVAAEAPAADPGDPAGLVPPPPLAPPVAPA
ncbi:hypothetical protein, partial [Nocardioides sp. ChNu-99]